MSEKQKRDAINYDQQLPDSIAQELTKSLIEKKSEKRKRQSALVTEERSK
jgi:nitrate/nitrite-specific signal transduction histidine kinase